MEHEKHLCELISNLIQCNGVARSLKKLRTSLLDQTMILFNCAPFQNGTSLKGKNLLPEGANSFLYEDFLIEWTFTDPLECYANAMCQMLCKGLYFGLMAILPSGTCRGYFNKHLCENNVEISEPAVQEKIPFQTNFLF